MKKKNARKTYTRSKQILSGDEMIIIFGGFLIIVFIILSLSANQTKKADISEYPTPTQSESSSYNY